MFKGQNTNHDWTIPVIASGKGTITYSGVITYKNHTTESIPPTDTDRDLIEFGPPNQVIISVLPDTTMIDFTKVKLVKLDLDYSDPAHNITMHREFKIKEGDTPAPWTFYARDPSKTSYNFATTYYLSTTPPQVVQVPAAPSSDTDLILMMPS